MEGGRFSGNPVSGADSECNREVTGKEAESGGTGQIRPGNRIARKSVRFKTGGAPRNSTREVECCSERAPGGRLSCGLANVRLKFVDKKVIY